MKSIFLDYATVSFKGDLDPAHVAERLSTNNPAPDWVASSLSW